MRQVVVIACSVLAVVASGGCRDGEARGGGSTVSVVASFHPLAELARRVGGERVLVTDLTPAGAEPHDLELSSDDVDRILDADVVVHAGRDFQPAVAEASERSDARVVDLSLVARTEVSGADGRQLDPHFWLDPKGLEMAGSEISSALASVDDSPGASRHYQQGLDGLLADLRALDAEIASALDSCRTRTFVTAHRAFASFAARYDLEEHGIAGLAPDAEPDPRRLDELIALVRSRNITTIFTEELVSPAVAEALAREAGVTTAVLDTIEGPADDGAPYEERMRRNLAALRAALDCP